MIQPLVKVSSKLNISFANIIRAARMAGKFNEMVVMSLLYYFNGLQAIPDLVRSAHLERAARTNGFANNVEARLCLSPSMKSLFDYHVVCHRDDNGSFVAYAPAIPGCHAIGCSPTGAQEALADVFEMIQDEYRERGEALPPDTQLVANHARQGS